MTRKLWFGLFLVAGLLWCRAAYSQVIYVDTDATGAETGSNWTDAFTDLQSALAWATAGWEIWVAEGQYVPTDGSDRTISFVIPDGVQLYGGFDGTETTRDERDWTIHESILSGDVGVPDDSTDNSYHVVEAISVGSSSVVDGFTVRHGRANTGAPPFDRGAGIYAPDSDITVRNSIFRWNGATFGGGIYSDEGAPELEDCLFEDNLANSGGGAYFAQSVPVLRRVTMLRNRVRQITFDDASGGLVEDVVVEDGQFIGVSILGSSPRFVRTEFRNNDNPTGDGGGVIIRDQSAPIFEDCLFEDNTAFGKGGGVIIEFVGASGLFVNSVFRNNVASGNAGGGAFVASEAVFLNCHFERNRALGDGAGLAADGTATVIGATFVGNRSLFSSSGGGALSLVGSPQAGESRLIANSLFAGNTGDNGGGVYAYSTEDTRMVNVTFAGNEGTTTGGAIYASNADGLEIQNAVLWGNEAPTDSEIHVAQGGAPTVERAIVEGGYLSGIDILDQNPLYVRNPDPGPDGNWGTDDDDYGDLRLREGRPGIDYGLQSFLPPDTWDLDNDGDTTEALPVDLNGDVRVQGAEVELGAYEGAVIVANEPDVPSPSETTLRVYPNPASDVLVVASDVDFIEIVDVLGRRVLQASSDNDETILDIGALSSGVYILRARSLTRVITVRR